MAPGSPARQACSVPSRHAIHGGLPDPKAARDVGGRRIGLREHTCDSKFLLIAELALASTAASRGGTAIDSVNGRSFGLQIVHLDLLTAYPLRLLS